jgi:hypothetical protein
VALDTRWEDVDALLTRNQRTQTESIEKAVQEIAEQRFKFPTPEHPSYRTYVNIPTVTMQVQVGDEQVTPDIVVVDKLNTGETHLVMTAVVEAQEGVTEAEAKARWARVAGVPNQAFYVYVPVGYGRKAKDICRRLKIKGAGFRTWRTTPRGFEINDVSEPPSSLSALMPPIVRDLLATP